MKYLDIGTVVQYKDGEGVKRRGILTNELTHDLRTVKGKGVMQHYEVLNDDGTLGWFPYAHIVSGAKYAKVKKRYKILKGHKRIKVLKDIIQNFDKDIVTEQPDDVYSARDGSPEVIYNVVWSDIYESPKDSKFRRKHYPQMKSLKEEGVQRVHFITMKPVRTEGSENRKMVHESTLSPLAGYHMSKNEAHAYYKSWYGNRHANEMIRRIYILNGRFAGERSGGGGWLGALWFGSSKTTRRQRRFSKFKKKRKLSRCKGERNLLRFSRKMGRR